MALLVLMFIVGTSVGMGGYIGYQAGYQAAYRVIQHDDQCCCTTHVLRVFLFWFHYGLYVWRSFVNEDEEFAADLGGAVIVIVLLILIYMGLPA